MRRRLIGFVLTALFAVGTPECRSSPGQSAEGVDPVRLPLTIVHAALTAETAAKTVPLGELGAEKWDGKPIRARGYVRNVFRDDIDPEFVIIVLQDGNVQAHAICRFAETPASLVGSEIVVEGVCRNMTILGSRRYLSHIVFFTPTNEIRVVRESYFGESVPKLDTARRYSVEEIQKLGLREAIGRVLAVTAPGEILVLTDNGGFVKAELTDARLPAVGQVVELVGFPVTDFYFLNLTGARWRASSADAPAVPPARPMTAARLYTDYRGQRGTPNTDYHGQRLSLTGVLRHIPSEEFRPASDRPLLDDGGILVPIVCDSCPGILKGLETGTKVTLTGICIVEVANWYPGATFPLVSNISLAPQSDRDVVVRARPSWWTTGRLLRLVVVLVAVLGGIGVWSILLLRKSERRGRALAKAEMAQYGARLRLAERTRLAVELHDSLSQTLAGIAMEVGTAAQFAESAPPDLACHLKRAVRTIDACRQELCCCLWDLRSRALEASSIEEAVRLTLARVGAHASVVIRFPVPRRYLSDNLVHNVLCIIRELVVNALRHGRASSVRIAGSLESGRLLFSVVDDGVGFDPSTAPGVREGHFGLQGIGERVSRLNGELWISSRTGEGTRVRVHLPISPDDGGGDHGENQDTRRG